MLDQKIPQVFGKNLPVTQNKLLLPELDNMDKCYRSVKQPMKFLLGEAIADLRPLLCCVSLYVLHY